MDGDQSELIIQWYLELEERIEVFFRNVPYRQDTANLFFPALASVFLDACSVLDATFREEYSGLVSRDDLAMPNYASEFESRLRLKNRRTLFLQYPPRYIQPFAGWTDQQGACRALKWWQDHNELKHDRIAKHQNATLENSLLSLCALHQVISQLPCFFHAAKRHNLLHFGQWNSNYIKNVIYTDPKGATILFESALFATPVGHEEFPADAMDINAVLFGRGNRLWRLV
jgi:hypothetical protein